MSEEEKKLYSVKFSGIVRFVGGSFEKFENVDVIRQSDNSIVLLKEKIPDLDPESIFTAATVDGRVLRTNPSRVHRHNNKRS